MIKFLVILPIMLSIMQKWKIYFNPFRVTGFVLNALRGCPMFWEGIERDWWHVTGLEFI